MAKYTVEVRHIYEINTEVGQEWGDLLDLSQKRWWQDGVEIDAVTLLSANTEVIEIEDN
jgi:hypothetical protein